MPNQVSKIEPATDQQMGDWLREIDGSQNLHGYTLIKMVRRLIARIEQDRERIRTDHPEILAAIAAMKAYLTCSGSSCERTVGKMMTDALKGLEELRAVTMGGEAKVTG